MFEYIKSLFDNGCPDCGVRRGSPHHPMCDCAICPSCDGQLLTCDCVNVGIDTMPKNEWEELNRECQERIASTRARLERAEGDAMRMSKVVVANALREPIHMQKQLAYCVEHNLPMFAPQDGICWSCNQQIPDHGDNLITGCTHCNRTYCD